MNDYIGQSAPVTVVADEPPRPRIYLWGDRLHHFPQDFKLPAVTPVAFWRLWLFGDGNVVNRPYLELHGKYMPKSQRFHLSNVVEAEKQFSEHYLILIIIQQ